MDWLTSACGGRGRKLNIIGRYEEKRKGSGTMKITDEMIEAAAKAAQGAWRRIACTGDDQVVWPSVARAALRAADAVAPEKGDLSEIIDAVLEAHEGRIGTHYEGCWKYHAACLALLLRDIGAVAPPKNEGENK